jgi:hypothetical protein
MSHCNGRAPSHSRQRRVQIESLVWCSSGGPWRFPARSGLVNAGKSDDRIIAQVRHGFQGHVVGAGRIICLEQEESALIDKERRRDRHAHRLQIWSRRAVGTRRQDRRNEPIGALRLRPLLAHPSRSSIDRNPAYTARSWHQPRTAPSGRNRARAQSFSGLLRAARHNRASACVPVWAATPLAAMSSSAVPPSA